MSGPITCRMATPADIPALIELLRELTALEADFAFAYAEHLRGLELLVAAQPATCVLVACGRTGVADANADGERIVGMCTGQTVISTAAGALSVWVEDVVVSSALRGAGIGGLLLSALEAWARERGAARMQLLADKDNLRALEFYGKQGWRQTNFGCWRKGLA